MAAKTGQEAYKLLEFQPQTVFLPNHPLNEPAHHGSIERRDSPAHPEMSRLYSRPDHANGFREPEYARVPPRDNWEPHGRNGPPYHENRGFDHSPPVNASKNPVYVLVPTNPGTAQTLEDSVYARCEPSKPMLDHTPSLHRKRFIERERYVERDRKGCCSCWCWTIAFVVILAILAVGAAVTAIVVIKLNVDTAHAHSGSRPGVIAATSRPDEENRVNFDVDDMSARRALVIGNTSDVDGGVDGVLLGPVMFPNETETIVANVSDPVSDDLPVGAFDVQSTGDTHADLTDDHHPNTTDEHHVNGTAFDVSTNATGVEFDMMLLKPDGSLGVVHMQPEHNTSTAVPDPNVEFTAAVLHSAVTPLHPFHHSIDPGVATTVLPLDRLAIEQSRHQAQALLNVAKNAKEIVDEVARNMTALTTA